MVIQLRHCQKPSKNAAQPYPRVREIKGARLAGLRLRWNHLGANFVYLGAHNGDTTSALPKAIPKIHLKTLSQWPCSSTIATRARKTGARLAVLRLRWNHLGANFVYLGTHNGNTTSALPKAIQKYTSKTFSPVALQADQDTKTPPKRFPPWPCKHDVTKNHPNMCPQNAFTSGPAAQP